MNISNELEQLINATLTDKKLSRKEKDVLVKKAVSEGIDEDEFEIYLESKLQISKSGSGNSRKILSFGKWIVEKKRRVIIAFFILSFVVEAIVLLAGGILENNEQNNLTEARGCKDVADCITKYKFEEARAYAGNSNSEIRDIIKAEVSFYLSNGEKQRAFNTLIEYNFNNTPVFDGYVYVNDNYNEEANWFNSIIKESLIVEFEDDKKTLKKILFSIKPNIISDGKDKESEYVYHFIEDNSTQKEMMKRYRIK